MSQKDLPDTESELEEATALVCIKQYCEWKLRQNLVKTTAP
jgi:hypothetical protein